MKMTSVEEDILLVRKTVSDLREEVDQLTMLQDISKSLEGIETIFSC